MCMELKKESLQSLLKISLVEVIGVGVGKHGSMKGTLYLPVD